MTLTELINRLEVIRDTEGGDIDVAILDGVEGLPSYYPITSTMFEAESVVMTKKLVKVSDKIKTDVMLCIG